MTGRVVVRVVRKGFFEEVHLTTDLNDEMERTVNRSRGKSGKIKDLRISRP